MKKYTESRRRGISYIKQNGERLNGLVTLRRKCLPKHVIEGTIEGMGRRGRSS
jgi:hypothetical protein